VETLSLAGAEGVAALPVIEWPVVALV